MASIQRRPNGKWRARYRDPSGREHARHFERKVDAQRWLDEQTAAMVTGAYVDPRAGRVRFREYAESWRLAAPHSPTMRDKVQRTLNLHIYPTFGDLPLGAVLPSAVQNWISSVLLAPASAKVALGYLSAVFKAAVRDRLVTANPCLGVSVPPGRRREVWIPDLATAEALREQLPERYRAVVDLVMGSGMRQGEVFGLEVEQLDFLRGKVVEVRQQLVCLSPHPPYLAEVKSAASARSIPLATLTLDALAAHLAAFPAGEVEVEDRSDPRNPITRTAKLVFTTSAPGPVTRSQWSQTWRPAARAAGIPERVGLHALRHFYASALIRHGESVKAVQRRLGHSSAAITLDTYTHLWPDSDDRTRQAVERALSVEIDHAADTVRTQGKLS